MLDENKQSVDLGEQNDPICVARKTKLDQNAGVFVRAVKHPDKYCQTRKSGFLWKVDLGEQGQGTAFFESFKHIQRGYEIKWNFKGRFRSSYVFSKGIAKNQKL